MGDRVNEDGRQESLLRTMRLSSARLTEVPPRIPTASSFSPTHHPKPIPEKFYTTKKECSLCFINKENIEDWGFLECGHVFCIDCLEKHFIIHFDFDVHERAPERAPPKTCPTCRKGPSFFRRMMDLPPEEQVKIYEQMSGAVPSSPRTAGGGSAPPPLPTPMSVFPQPAPAPPFATASAAAAAAACVKTAPPSPLPRSESAQHLERIRQCILSNEVYNR